jgi:hypothetical protein
LRTTINKKGAETELANIGEKNMKAMSTAEEGGKRSSALEKAECQHCEHS